MKLNYTTKNGRLSAEIEAESQRELFSELNRFQEVFEETTCGKCQTDDPKWVVRTVDDNQYHEVKCAACGAKLAFGSHKKGGGLFPKRKDGDTWLPDGGWQKWNSKTKQME
jgi:hypothetical protein